ncbi:PQ loop repeat protein-like protein [Plenodomus tracheiphilus IPT5]|uniref:PQ loop repeat protein-like protein n=1 Tax=Plenodomus tracheiphilus IPT5 TaxID=1408161 RepID=A0A6A7AN20_9PLEO|nr:PQ loop repeat protein-like protein [Plenodomus tracheiphilus IPT5]
MTSQTSPVPNIFGAMATTCWCINLLPQIRRNYRTKTTTGLPASMLVLWAASGALSSVYAYSQRFSIALILQPNSFAFFCSVSLAQCLVRWRMRKAICLVVALVAAFGVVETILILALRWAHRSGWPVLLIGAVACLLDLAGFLPLPFELMKRRGRIVGISFLFLGLDWLGFAFSLVALTTQHPFDLLFGTTAAICCAIWSGTVISHLTWLFRTRELRKCAKEAGLTFDQYEDGIYWQAQGLDVSRALRGFFSDKKRAGVTVEEV